MQKSIHPITIAFEVQATVHQTIQLTIKDMTEEDVVTGLRNGAIITTLWHTQGEPGDQECLLLDLRKPDTEQQIGIILSQQVDGDYMDFR